MREVGTGGEQRYESLFGRGLRGIARSVVASFGRRRHEFRTDRFYWRVTDILALTDGGFVFIEQIPEGIKTLVDTPAEDLLLLGAFMRDEQDRIVGIASELDEFHRPLTDYMTEENVYLGFDGAEYEVRTRLTFYIRR